MLPLSATPPPATVPPVPARVAGEPVPTGGEGNEFDTVLAEMPDGKAQVPVEPGSPSVDHSSAGPPPGACPLVQIDGVLQDETILGPETKGANAAQEEPTAALSQVPMPDQQDQVEPCDEGDDSTGPDPSFAQIVALPVDVALAPAKLAAGKAEPGLTAAVDPHVGREISTRPRTVASMDDAPPVRYTKATLSADHEATRPTGLPTIKHGYTSEQDAPASASPGMDAASAATDGVAAGVDGLEDAGRSSEFASVALQPGFATDIKAPGRSDATSDHRPLATVPSGIATEPVVLGAEIARIARSGTGDAVEILLAPHELGRLRIRVSSESDAARVTVQAERPETLDLLRRNGDVLIKELRAAGFSGGTLDFAGWSDGNQRSASPMAQGQVPAGEDFPFAEVRPVLPSGAVRTDAGLYLRL